MKRVFVILSAIAVIFTAPALAKSDAKLDAPPAGITPTTATLSQILKSYDTATGKLAPSVADTRQETWTFTKAGLPGSETLVRKGSDYYSHIVGGPIVNEYGQLAGQRWHKDANGVVSPVLADDYTSFEMMIFTQSFDDALDPKNDVTVLGEVTDPQPAYVLAVKSAGDKHPEWVYYDKKSGLIDRITRIVDDTHVTTTYDDYRATKGRTQPWHLHYTDGTAALDEDFTRKSLQLGAPVNAAQFAMPASSFAFASYPGHLAIPAKVMDDSFDIDIGHDQTRTVISPTVVVRLTIAGRGLDFAVSAAEPDSLIDSQVARELNLSGYGQVTRANNEDVPYDTVVAQADLGGIALHNLAMRATPFHYHLSSDVKVVGMIGYDILSTGIFKINYDDGTLDLYPPQTFNGDPPVTGAYTIPLLFDSGMPFFKGTIDSHDTENVLFDNDFTMSYVFGSFIDRYPESVKDVVTGQDHASAVIPFADSKGYGKEVSIWLGRVPDIKFGPAHFQDFQLIAADGNARIDGHDVDAVMGGDLLQYFDIYMDFPHARVYLKPNKAFFRVFQIKAAP